MPETFWSAQGRRRHAARYLTDAYAAAWRHMQAGHPAAAEATTRIAHRRAARILEPLPDSGAELAAIVDRVGVYGAHPRTEALAADRADSAAATAGVLAGDDAAGPTRILSWVYDGATGRRR